MSETNMLTVAGKLQELSGQLVHAIDIYRVLVGGQGLEDLEAKLCVTDQQDGLLELGLPLSVLLQIVKDDPKIREKLDQHVLHVADSLVAQLEELRRVVSYIRSAATLPTNQENDHAEGQETGQPATSDQNEGSDQEGFYQEAFREQDENGTPPRADAHV